MVRGGGYVFEDTEGAAWWIIFQQSSEVGAPLAQVRGDVLACSDSHGETIHVRVLARGVLRNDADAAFGEHAPFTYEDAVAVAAGIPARHGRHRRTGLAAGITR
jgi:hypothetical protein